MMRCLVFFVLIFPCLVQAQSVNEAGPKGTIDLRGYSFAQRESFRITQPWAFYWNQLLTPSTITNAKDPAWLTAGNGWLSGGFDGLGVGTYRMRLLLPEHQRGLSIYFPTINSASRIWLNGLLTGGSGMVSSKPDIYRPELTSLLLSIPEKEDTVDIIIQVANFAQTNGGLWGYPLIDRTADLVEDQNRSNGIENFFAGSLMAMCLYQLILYFLYRRGKPFLWLSLICLGVAIRTMVIHGGSFLLPKLFPDVPWEIWKQLEFGAVYAIIAFFPLYVHDLFETHASRRILMVFVVVGAISVTVVIFTHQVVYALLLEVAHVAYLLGFAYAVYVIGSAWRAGNRDAKIILFGIIACFPFILLEIMKNSQFIGLDIPSMYFVEMGVLVFLLFQVYLLANHQAKSHKALEAMNINLEGIVNERTQELIAANVVRDRLLSVISHDVRSPLNSLQGMLDLYNTGMVTPGEFQEFSKKIQNHLGNTGLLVENILVWTTSQLKGARIVNDRFSLSDLVNRNMQLFQSAATAKQITLASTVPDGMEITWDKNIVHLALRNLIANAIKYSHPGGRIDISAVKAGTKVHLTVKDYGIGIDPDTMNTILAQQRSTSREGTNKESGSGIGLSLVREFLVYAGGSLSAESVEGKGSQFTIEIPQ